MVPFPNLKPVTAMLLGFVIVFGLTDSMAIMVISVIVSGIFLGFSILIVGQIIAYTIIIMLFYAISSRFGNIVLNTFLAGLLALLYGILIDIFAGEIYGFGTGGLVGYWLAGFSFDLLHSISTIGFYPVILTTLSKLSNKEIFHY
ncbi:hypothetical protein [Lactococcus lactis]